MFFLRKLLHVFTVFIFLFSLSNEVVSADDFDLDLSYEEPVHPSLELNMLAFFDMLESMEEGIPPSPPNVGTYDEPDDRSSYGLPAGYGRVVVCGLSPFSDPPSSDPDLPFFKNKKPPSSGIIPPLSLRELFQRNKGSKRQRVGYGPNTAVLMPAPVAEPEAQEPEAKNPRPRKKSRTKDKNDFLKLTSEEMNERLTEVLRTLSREDKTELEYAVKFMAKQARSRQEVFLCLCKIYVPKKSFIIERDSFREERERDSFREERDSLREEIGRLFALYNIGKYSSTTSDKGKYSSKKLKKEYKYFYSSVYAFNDQILKGVKDAAEVVKGAAYARDLFIQARKFISQKTRRKKERKHQGNSTDDDYFNEEGVDQL
jgi:hypothetical protein